MYSVRTFDDGGDDDDSTRDGGLDRSESDNSMIRQGLYEEVAGDEDEESDASDDVVRGDQPGGGGAGGSRGGGASITSARTIQRVCCGMPCCRWCCCCDDAGAGGKGSTKCRIFFLVLTVLLIGLTATYAVLRLTDRGGGNQSSPSESPTTSPSPSAATPTPPSENVNVTAEDIARIEQIAVRLFQLSDSAQLPILDPAVPEHAAYKFIASSDPRKVSPDDPDLVQRYVMATIYYSAGAIDANWDGELEVSPGGIEDGGLPARFPWMSGAHECDWSFVVCVDVRLYGDDVTGDNHENVSPSKAINDTNAPNGDAENGADDVLVTPSSSATIAAPASAPAPIPAPTNSNGGNGTVGTTESGGIPGTERRRLTAVDLCRNRSCIDKEDKNKTKGESRHGRQGQNRPVLFSGPYGEGASASASASGSESEPEPFVQAASLSSKTDYDGLTKHDGRFGFSVSKRVVKRRLPPGAPRALRDVEEDGFSLDEYFDYFDEFDDGGASEEENFRNRNSEIAGNGNRSGGSADFQKPGMTKSGTVVALYFKDINLTGPLPEEIKALGNLEILDLQHNMLNGTIPEELGFLTLLKTLRLNNNNFHGKIPDSFGKLSDLEELDLGNNNLSGQIPQSVCDLKLPRFGSDFATTLPNVMCDCCSDDIGLSTTSSPIVASSVTATTTAMSTSLSPNVSDPILSEPESPSLTIPQMTTPSTNDNFTEPNDDGINNQMGINTTVSSPICADATKTIYEYSGSRLLKAEETFLRAFDDSCREINDAPLVGNFSSSSPQFCPQVIDEVVIDYTSITSNFDPDNSHRDAYQDFVDACNAREGYLICPVSSTWGTGVSTIKSIAQPICVPPNCASSANVKEALPIDLFCPKHPGRDDENATVNGDARSAKKNECTLLSVYQDCFPSMTPQGASVLNDGHLMAPVLPQSLDALSSSSSSSSLPLTRSNVTAATEDESSSLCMIDVDMMRLDAPLYVSQLKLFDAVIETCAETSTAAAPHVSSSAGMGSGVDDGSGEGGGRGRLRGHRRTQENVPTTIAVEPPQVEPPGPSSSFSSTLTVGDDSVSSNGAYGDDIPLSSPPCATGRVIHEVNYGGMAEHSSYRELIDACVYAPDAKFCTLTVRLNMSVVLSSHAGLNINGTDADVNAGDVNPENVTDNDTGGGKDGVLTEMEVHLEGVPMCFAQTCTVEEMNGLSSPHILEQMIPKHMTLSRALRSHFVRRRKLQRDDDGAGDGVTLQFADGDSEVEIQGDDEAKTQNEEGITEKEEASLINGMLDSGTVSQSTDQLQVDDELDIGKLCALASSSLSNSTWCESYIEFDCDDGNAIPPVSTLPIPVSSTPEDTSSSSQPPSFFTTVNMITSLYGDASGDLFSSAISLSGDGQRIAIASKDSSSNEGKVRVYELVVIKPEEPRRGRQKDGGAGGGNREGEASDNVTATLTTNTVLPTRRWEILGSEINLGTVPMWWQSPPYGRGDREENPISLSMSHDGTALAIGTFGFDVETDNIGGGGGRVRFYSYRDGDWIFLSSLKGDHHNDTSTASKDEEYGASVALSGDASILAVGAPGRHNGTGGVYLFHRNKVDDGKGEHWVPIGGGGKGIVEGRSIGGGRFGASISLHTQTRDQGNEFLGQDGSGIIVLAVGAPEATILSGRDEDVEVGGYVCVFELHSANGGDGSNDTSVAVWSSSELDLIHRTNLDDGFGHSISLSNNGSTIAIGSPLAAHPQDGIQRGRFTIYDHQQVGEGEMDKVWTERLHSSEMALGGPEESAEESAQEDPPTDLGDLGWGWGEQDGDRAGYSVSFSQNGKILVVGFPGLDDPIQESGGYAKIYQFQQGERTMWTELGRTTFQDIKEKAEAGDAIGSAVNISSDGRVVVIGVPMSKAGERGKLLTFQLT